MRKREVRTMPKKRKEPEPEPEPEPVEEEEEDEEEDHDGEEEEAEEEGGEEEAPNGETSEARVRRLKAARRNTRRNARQNGYRRWARSAGLKPGCANSFGNDMLEGVFSASDVVRMATWSPHSADVGMEVPAFKEVLAMRDESLPSGPVKVLQANVESFARKVIGEVVMRSMESGGPATISAANIRSVLRPFNEVLRIDFSTPLGLVRAAQCTPKGDTTVVERGADEDAAIAEERKFVKSNQAKLMREADKRREARIEERRKNRGKAKKAKTAAAATEEVVAATATA